MRSPTALIGLACVLILASSATAAPAPVSPLAYVDEALKVAREKSFHSGEVDWPALTEREHKAVEGAADALDVYPVVVDILVHLGDGHSFMQVSPDRRAAFTARHGYAFSRALGERKRPTSSFSDRKTLKSQRLDLQDKSIEVFNVPSFLGGGELANDYAQTLYDAQAAAAPWACGYVVDLRGNGGGNVWPMLAGLEPLLGEGRVSGHRDRIGIHWIALKDGKSQLSDDGAAPQTIAHTRTWAKLAGLDSAPVAVLIDDATASSAEGVAIAFRTRTDTRFFGDHTYGISTSNEGFPLSDGANLVITTGLMVDRQGHDQDHGVAPDVAVDPHLAPDGRDQALEQAAAWVAGRAACPKA